MEGFVFDRDMFPRGEDACTPKHERLHLSPLGILLLARCGIFMNISLQDIRDKSKADGLAKTIVCVQAGWMVLQTLGRVCANQPVTLLEVNTLGHIFCAFVIYILWWHKPKEVKEPTVIRGTSMPSVCAFFYMSSRISGPTPDRKLHLAKWTKPEITNYVWDTNGDLELLHHIPKRSYSIKHSCILENLEDDTRCGFLRESHASPVHDSGCDAAAAANILPSLPTIPVPGDNPHLQRIRQYLASQALRSFPALQGDALAPSSSALTTTSSPTSFRPPRLAPRQLLSAQASDWPSDYYLPGIAGQLMGMILWLSAVGYGAVHAAAWSEYFPTPAERLLWRFSSIYITGASAFWLVLNALAFRAPWAKEWYHRFVALEGQLARVFCFCSWCDCLWAGVCFCEGFFGGWGGG